MQTTFHEPFVLFGYLAGITALELVTGVIILPQRQTALVAKQAAEVDLLTDGRFRLGIGVGWNAVEYEALGETSRPRQADDEQIALLRRLWTEPAVTHEGTFDQVDGAGLAPLPVQRPIPIWIGGAVPARLPAHRAAGRRVVPAGPPGRAARRGAGPRRRGRRAAGRDPSSIGMEGRVSWTADGVDKLVHHVGRWREADATHVSINTMGAGLATVDDHLEVLARGGRRAGAVRPRSANVS